MFLIVLILLKIYSLKYNFCSHVDFLGGKLSKKHKYGQFSIYSKDLAFSYENS